MGTVGQVRGFLCFYDYDRFPPHSENRKNGQKNSVRENTGKLEILPKHSEFWFAQVVNSLILNSIFAAKIPNLCTACGTESVKCIANFLTRGP